MHHLLPQKMSLPIDMQHLLLGRLHFLEQQALFLFDFSNVLQDLGFFRSHAADYNQKDIKQQIANSNSIAVIVINQQIWQPQPSLSLPS